MVIPGNWRNGGICCNNSAATITNCIIANNIGDSPTGGILFEKLLDWESYSNKLHDLWQLRKWPYRRDFCISSNPSYYRLRDNAELLRQYRWGTTHRGCKQSLHSKLHYYRERSGCKRGGVYSTENSNPTFSNTILWNNYPSEIWADPAYPRQSGCPVLRYRGGWCGSGTNNINADPEFIDFGLWPNEIPQIYYRLAAGSPCIDAGSSDFGAPNDIDNKDRYDDPLTPNTGGDISLIMILAPMSSKHSMSMVRLAMIHGRLTTCWNGSSGPKKTIQAGLNVAVTGEQ